jgi:imidazole glycerol-phosphate synthase subunit HisF
MLKTRVMPTLLYRDYGMVKGVSFDSCRHVGSLMQSIKVYNFREVDELVFLDIKATREGRGPNYNLVDNFADECFMPLTIGGGIRTIEHVRRLLSVGADKVSINSCLVEDISVVAKVASLFGSQCVVASIDFKRVGGNDYKVCIHSGNKIVDLDPVDLARRCEESGAGEILLTSVDLDGTMEGYELEILKAVSQAVDIPVIASGGAGNYEHMYQALIEGGASAVAAASIFHFTEQTPLEAKHYLKDRGIPTRV